MADSQNYDNRILFFSGKEAIEDLSGFRIRIQPGFDYSCNLKITKDVAPKPLRGLTFPENFRFESLISMEDLMSLMSLWGEFCSAVGDSEIIDFWRPLIKPKNTQKSDPLNAFTQRLLKARSETLKRYSSGVVDYHPSIHPDKLKQGQYPDAFIPERSWFKKEIQEVELKDIFTLFPEAEAELLAICLGRALAGCSGTRHMESNDPIRHTFRTFPLIFGMPGLGKSVYFKDFLIPAMKLTGYDVSGFVTLYEKFGLGRVAESALSYKDDLSTSELLANMSGKYAKTLITGGFILVEDKFIASYEAWSRTVLIAPINEFDMSQVAKLDEGILDRLVVLQTYTDVQLKRWKGTGASKGSQSPLPESHLRYLCRKYDVDMETLALWTMRLCCDHFMKIIAKNDPIKGVNNLASTVKRLSRRLEVQITDALMTKNTCMLFQFCHRLRKPGAKVPEIGISVLKEYLYDAAYISICEDMQGVRDIVEMDWEEKGRPDPHPWLGFKNLRNSSLVNAINRLTGVTKGHYSKDITEAIKAVFGSMVTRSGFNLSYSKVKVISNWKNTVRDVYDLEPLHDLIYDTLSKEQVKLLQAENPAAQIEIDIQGNI